MPARDCRLARRVCRWAERRRDDPKCLFLCRSACSSVKRSTEPPAPRPSSPHTPQHHAQGTSARARRTHTRAHTRGTHRHTPHTTQHKIYKSQGRLSIHCDATDERAFKIAHLLVPIALPKIASSRTLSKSLRHPQGLPSAWPRWPFEYGMLKASCREETAPAWYRWTWVTGWARRSA